MSFGNSYTNRFMIDFEAGWTEEALRDWADTNHYDITPVNDNLRHYRNNGGNVGRPVLMLYTSLSEAVQNRLCGYFIPRAEVTEVYGPEGWDLVSSIPEEIII